MTHTVLLTGARAPATLDLARKFHRQGWRVLTAESLPVDVCDQSNAVARSFRVPPPRFAPQQFIQALHAISDREAVDLIVPTCEEVFTVAAGREHLWGAFVEPLERLITLHSKARFIERAASYGLLVPETQVITSREAARAALGAEVVLKPEFSRFATQTIVRPHHPHDLLSVDARSDRRWVVQQFISGQALCTYSIAHGGRLTAHGTYPVTYTAGNGAAISFSATAHHRAQEWTAQFVAAANFTGQIALDFIETPSGALYAIECNPRATSGVHLFDDDLVTAIHDPDAALIVPPDDRLTSIQAAMWVYGWRGAASLADWWRTIWRSDDVIAVPGDRAPVWSQVRTLAHLMGVAARERISLLAASTHDIEWNG